MVYGMNYEDLFGERLQKLRELIEDLKSLEEEQIKNIHGIVKGLKGKNCSSF